MLLLVRYLFEGHGDVSTAEQLEDIKEIDGERLLVVLDSRIDRGLLEVDEDHFHPVSEPGLASSKSIQTYVDRKLYSTPCSA
jgi:hypothetical protein